MKLLDQKIKAYYEQLPMPEQRFDRLLQSVEELEAEKDNISISRRKLYMFTSAAALLFTFVLMVQHFMLHRDIAQLVFAEIAMNHNKHQQPEFVISNYSELGQSMQRINFTLMPPKIIQASYDLLGGRYCSIRGNIAAQLKIKDKRTGKVATLYITQLNRDLEKITPHSTTIDHTDIQIWNSDQRFYGLAVDAVEK